MDFPAKSPAGMPDQLAEWFSRFSRAERVKSGAILAVQGAPAPGLILVRDALIARITPQQPQPPHEFGLDGPGSVAMPFAVLGQGLAPWDLVVRRPGEIWTASLAELGGLPAPLKLHVETLAAEQTAALVRHLAMFGKRSARALVAARLLDYFAVLGEDRLGITHDQIARRMALRRATVTIALQELEGMHAIRSRRGSIELTSTQVLREAAGQVV